MRRIAILFEYATVNGGENSMLAALQHLQQSAGSTGDLEFTAIAPRTGPLAERLRDQQLPVVDFQLFNGHGQRIPREAGVELLHRAVHDSAADLVHANSLAMGRLTGVATDAGLPLPSTAHLRDIMKLNRAAVTDLNRNRRLIAVSDATRDFHGRQGLESSRAVTVYNGIDIARFVPSGTRESQRTRLRGELGIPERAPVVLTVGQIGLRKGLDTLSHAACRLASRRRGIHWLLAGERFSTKTESIQFERDVLDQFAKGEPQLYFHRLGYRTDVASLMLASDVLVHAAREEPFGRVLLEAAATGLPIVATRVGGTEEMLHDGEHALLVSPDDVEAIASATENLLSDRALARSLAAATQLRIREEFSLERSARQLAAVWNEVLS